MNLKQLHNKIKKCKKCSLYKKRKNVVPGEGKGKIMFIGESPGREEDKTGRPFIGRAGKFLTKELKKIKINRKNCFITSVVKCYTKKPNKEQINKCKPYLFQQIKLIKPKLIVLLGDTALNAFFKKKLKDIHGKFLKKDNKKFFITYHPASAMRFPKIRKRFVVDIKKIKKYY